MKTTEIDDDIYEYLASRTMIIGESISDILRRELRMSGAVQTDNNLVTRIDECINSSIFRSKLSVVGKLLEVLRWLYEQEPEKFKQVLTLGGHRRRYFALTKGELEASGKSVNPKEIPNTPYWVITNTSTNDKKKMLKELMQLLDFDDGSIGVAINALYKSY